MIYSEEIKIGLKDIDKNLIVKDSAILEYLENIAIRHADSLGYGLKENTESQVNWVLLDWKVEKLQSIKYGQMLNVNTWSKSIEKCYGYRNFEIYNQKGELCVVATSKWLLLNTKTKSIVKADEKLINDFDSHPDKTVLKNETFEKLAVLDNFEVIKEYEIKRRDIDMLGHVHNIYYLDLAKEILPQEVFDCTNFKTIRISYRKEMKYKDVVKLKYVKNESKYVITITNNDDSVIHSIIELE
ncbi:MAG: hypothetical protein IJW82_03045 [Clostridia bacterium]|nr:hypothetical protein [Clostridia bacterium]